MEEDRYKEMLSRSDSENVINSYFKLKRTSQLLGREAHKGHGRTRTRTRHWCDDQRQNQSVYILDIKVQIQV